MPYIHCYVALIIMKGLYIIFILLIILIVIVYLLEKRHQQNLRNIQEYELREIKYNCYLLNEMWNKLSDEEKKLFWGTTITTIPNDFSDSLNSIETIYDWCFY